MTPEKVFERRWAMTLLAQVLDVLRQEWTKEGRGREFEALKECLGGGEGVNQKAGGGARWVVVATTRLDDVAAGPTAAEAGPARRAIGTTSSTQSRGNTLARRSF